MAVTSCLACSSRGSCPLEQVGQYWLLMAVVFFGGTIQLALVVSPMMSVGPLQDRRSAKEYLIGVTAQEYAFVFLRAIAIRNWASGRFLLGAAVLQWGSGSLFGLVAPAFLGAAVAGIMRACQSLVNATNIWVQGLENSLPSQASERYRAGGPAALRSYLIRAETVLVGGTLGLALMVIVAPKFWLQLLYGHRLDGYGYLLQAYCNPGCLLRSRTADKSRSSCNRTYRTCIHRLCRLYDLFSNCCPTGSRLVWPERNKCRPDTYAGAEFAYLGRFLAPWFERHNGVEHKSRQIAALILMRSHQEKVLYPLPENRRIKGIAAERLMASSSMRIDFLNAIFGLR